jgi:hypothetical protein
MNKIPPMPAEVAVAAERAYPSILDLVRGVIVEARGSAARRGERRAFACTAWAIARFDHTTASRIAAAAIVELATAKR